jgi:hypothetical protein
MRSFFRARPIVPWVGGLAAVVVSALLCGCKAGDAGVHVVVHLDQPDSGDWATIAFDHVTVRATSGSRTAVVCLTPRSEGKRAIVVPPGAPSDPDPCADMHGGAYAGVNGVYPPESIYDDWDFTTSPWVLNFDAVRAGETVSVEGKAVFGGAASVGAPVGVMSTRGQARADSSFPTVDLAFVVPQNDLFWGPPDRRCDQGDDLSSWTNPSTFKTQAANPRACPRAEPALSYSDALVRVSTPSDVVGRIPPVVASGCPGGEPDGVIVWKSDPIAVDAPCTSLQLTGRFARCASGDARDPAGCATSVRCVPPPTDLVVLAGQRIVQSQSISCVPSYPEPVQYLMPYNDLDAGPITVAIRRGPSDGGCFFDLYDFSAQAGCGP